MSRLHRQGLIVQRLRDQAIAERASLVACSKAVEIPVARWFTRAGTALNLAELAPVAKAVWALVACRDHVARRIRLLGLLIEIPTVYRVLRRVFQKPKPLEPETAKGGVSHPVS